MSKRMWVIGLVTAILSSASVFPVIVGNPNELLCVAKVNPKLNQFCLVISTTTSLPTLVIEGVDTLADTIEIQERIQAELNGDIEPVLLLELAEQNHLTLDQIKQKIQKGH